MVNTLLELGAKKFEPLKTEYADSFVDQKCLTSPDRRCITNCGMPRGSDGIIARLYSEKQAFRS